jgi:hypothetical protein
MYNQDILRLIYTLALNSDRGLAAIAARHSEDVPERQVTPWITGSPPEANTFYQPCRSCRSLHRMPPQLWVTLWFSQPRYGWESREVCEDVYLIRTRHDQVTPGERPEEKEKWIHLAFTWSGKSFTLDIAESDRSEHLARPRRASYKRPETTLTSRSSRV